MYTGSPQDKNLIPSSPSVTYEVHMRYIPLQGVPKVDLTQQDVVFKKI